jgi:hypothetical protein
MAGAAARGCAKEVEELQTMLDASWAEVAEGSSTAVVAKTLKSTLLRLPHVGEILAHPGL